jgi:hypothetical protein
MNVTTLLNVPCHHLGPKYLFVLLKKVELEYIKLSLFLITNELNLEKNKFISYFGELF